MRDLSGIHAMLYALFDADERLDRAAMRRQVAVSLEAGAAGITALGLATEVAKLAEAERRVLMDWVAEDVGGRVPLGFTIFGGSVAEQVAQVRHAERAGADWVILQPPMVGAYAASEYLDFFARVSAATALPVAIQNAPAYMGRGLSAADMALLVGRAPNIRYLKAEGPAIEIAGVIAAVGAGVRVFNGRGGLELLDNLRVGCAGLLLAPDLIDLAVAAHAHLRAGEDAAAEAIYARMLPAICFVMQSIETLICYGKRLFCLRAGLPVHDRAPALRPSPAGEAALRRYADALGPLGRLRPLG
jgi:4-hydroxy-tetrahydrodipicolinate synthase